MRNDCGTTMQLHGVMLFAAELDTMVAFHRDVVGFAPIEESRLDDWVEFDTGGATFALHQIPRGSGVKPSPAPRESGSCKPILAVEDAAAVHERLACAGETILDRPWGGWDFADPEGNVLGVQLRTRSAVGFRTRPDSPFAGHDECPIFECRASGPRS